LKDEDIPHRTKMTALIREAFEAQREELKKELSRALGRISFTADIWDCKKRQAFLAITGHWV
ncbi:hypothetical protein FOMPIDRAFT_24463, partial [Fomitopsis schrenkii]